jgi:superfamily II DNA or RNA helicase
MASDHVLAVPELAIPIIREETGELHFVLRPAIEADVTRTEDVPISPGRTATGYHLASGELLLVTDYGSCPCPPEAHGVLLRSTSKELAWFEHRDLTATRTRVENGEWAAIRRESVACWEAGFRYQAEMTGSGMEKPGLRPPQMGGLYEIAGHWCLHRQPATIVMPTGTGKTETMLAAFAAFVRGTLLVVVPSKALRDQTVRKFRTLGLLRALGVLPANAPNPIVGVLTRRPTCEDDLVLFDRCHVVVAVINTVAQGVAESMLPAIASRCSHLFLDEAHHVAAESWSTLRDAFDGKPVIQFTATPFRRDGRAVDGKAIFTYPLHQAQVDGYFKPISFVPVFEIDPDASDQAIARAAVARLEEDRAKNLDHILMARCSTIARANAVFEAYQSIGAAHQPVLVHSKDPGAREALDRLRRRESRIVVCVDMLGEGFDLPQLKIAALHDCHKSLSVTLQFVGRFTRTAGADIGDATVIANLANADVPIALERLYSEDADWNHLLSELSSEAVQEHLSLITFLQNSKRLDEMEEGDALALVAPKSLFPKYSAVAYRCKAFRPKLFKEWLEQANVGTLQATWLNESERVLFFITRSESRVSWSRTKALRERTWDLYVLYYNESQRLLFIHSTNRETLYQGLAKAVSKETAELLAGDVMFRCFGRVNRLLLQVVGLKRSGRRNLRFSMHSGADVAAALHPTQTGTTTKSNLFGTGFEGGHPVAVGCSYKGRIWSRENGTIPGFMRWCDAMGSKLLDATIDTSAILENVLIPEEVTDLPETQILCIDWPDELLHRSEDQVVLDSTYGKIPLWGYGIALTASRPKENEIQFRIAHETHGGEYALRIGGGDFRVVHLSGERFDIQIGRASLPLEAWLSENAPDVLYVDGSELDGTFLVRPSLRAVQAYPPTEIEAWDWTGIDIKKESMWKKGVIRSDSVQWKTAEVQKTHGFDVIFNDDAAGEAADLVCIKRHSGHIQLRLVHCKYTTSDDPGERVKDVVEVCSQAVRSSRWAWRFSDLSAHLLAREKNLPLSGITTRFLTGTAKILNQLVRLSRVTPVKVEIAIVQPGLSQASVTPDQAMVLNAANGYLRDTVNIGLAVIGSA